MTAKTCTACSVEFGLRHWRHICPTSQGGCGKTFCSGCLNYCCVSDSDAAQADKMSVSTVCKECFQRLSSLDFTTPVTVYGPPAGTAPTIVFVHGGGGSRLMFCPHAKQLADSAGIRCVLLDLPGHGARMDVPLTLDSAIATILADTQEHAPPFGDKRPLYVGGSLGGYIGMELLARSPQTFAGAVIAMCGQNVGVGRGAAAGIGLFVMDKLLGMVSAATMLKQLWAEARKIRAIPDALLLECSLRPGMFFSQGHAQVQILSATNPAVALAQYPSPVLFVNGSLDHRDSEQRWAQSCGGGGDTSGKKAQVRVYEGGNHFFSHDTRFMQMFVDDVLAFSKQVWG